MSTIYRGGCRCGAIRYEIAAEPMFGGQCQCLDCQRETGGGHASFMAFPADAVKLTGTPRFYEAKADSGWNELERGGHFAVFEHRRCSHESCASAFGLCGDRGDA